MSDSNLRYIPQQYPGITDRLVPLNSLLSYRTKGLELDSSVSHAERDTVRAWKVRDFDIQPLTVVNTTQGPFSHTLEDGSKVKRLSTHSRLSSAYVLGTSYTEGNVRSSTNIQLDDYTLWAIVKQLNENMRDTQKTRPTLTWDKGSCKDAIAEWTQHAVRQIMQPGNKHAESALEMMRARKVPSLEDFRFDTDQGTQTFVISGPSKTDDQLAWTIGVDNTVYSRLLAAAASVTGEQSSQAST